MRAFILFFALSWLLPNRADIVTLCNGDRFTGSVELVDASEIRLQSEALGVVKIPRAKVASIYFGTNQPTASLSGKDLNSVGQFDPKAVEKVQEDFLATAGPEANAMFKEMIQGLASGKLYVEDIRNQARESLKELKELQADGGEDANNPLISSYVSILENFIDRGSTNRAKIAPPKVVSPDQKAAEDK
jgi:hypothetical protein